MKQTMQRSVSENHLFMSSSTTTTTDYEELVSDAETEPEKNEISKASTLLADQLTKVKNGNDELTSHSVSAFSNATYCVTKEQLQGVLLKKSDQIGSSTKINCTSISSEITATKNGLIEELKMAKDLDGIKRVKQLHGNEVMDC